MPRHTPTKVVPIFRRTEQSHHNVMFPVTSKREARSSSWGKGHHVLPADFKGLRAKTTPSGFKQREGLFCRVKLIENSLEN